VGTGVTRHGSSGVLDVGAPGPRAGLGVLRSRRHVGHRLVGDRAGGYPALDGHAGAHDLSGTVANHVADADALAHRDALAEGAG